MTAAGEGDRTVRGRCVAAGQASGPALVTRQRVGGWNAIDVRRGRIVERGHELEGAALAGRVLIFKGAGGSSGWSAVLHQLRLSGQAPAALLFASLSAKAALGAVVAHVPAMTDFERPLADLVDTDDWLDVDAAAGVVRIRKALALLHANSSDGISHVNERTLLDQRGHRFK